MAPLAPAVRQALTTPELGWPARGEGVETGTTDVPTMKLFLMAHAGEAGVRTSSEEAPGPGDPPAAGTPAAGAPKLLSKSGVAATNLSFFVKVVLG